MQLVYILLTVLILFNPSSKASAESGGVHSTGQFSRANINKKAPDFTLADTKNQPVRLSDFKGKYVVLEWFNQACPFVKKHYESSNMQKLQKEYTGKGVIWLSICSSAPGKHGYESSAEHERMFAEKHAVPSAILADPEGKVGRLYGVKNTPTMYVINPQGILIYAGAIDDTPGVDVSEISSAKNYVRAALDQSMAGKEVSTPQTKSYGCSVKY